MYGTQKILNPDRESDIFFKKKRQGKSSDPIENKSVETV